MGGWRDRVEDLREGERRWDLLGAHGLGASSLVVVLVRAVLGLVRRCREGHHRRLAELFAYGLNLERQSWLRGL